MSTNELIDSGLRAYRLLGWDFLRLTVTPSLFCLAALAFVLQVTLPALGTTRYGSSVTAQVGESALTLIVALFVAGPLFLIGLSYSTAIVVHLTSVYMVGDQPTGADAVRSARTTLPKLVGLGFRELLLSLSGIGVAIAIMMLGALLSRSAPSTELWGGIVAAVGVLGLGLGLCVFLWVVARHALCPAILVIEGGKAGTAARRSSTLLQSRPYHPAGTGSVFALYLLMFVVALVEWGGLAVILEAFEIHQHLENLLAGIPFQGILLAAVDLLPPFLVVWTVIPIWAATITILYYERRIRLEGYDIEALAEDIALVRTNRFDV